MRDFSSISAYFWAALLRCHYSMKWITYVLVAGSLCLSELLALEVRAQVRQPQELPEGLASMEGTIQDASTKKVIIGAVVGASSEVGTMRAQQVVTTGDGAFRFILDPKQSYRITVRAEGYEPYARSLAFTSPKADRLQLQPIRLYRTGTKPPQNTTVADAKVPTTSAMPVRADASTSAAATASPVATPPTGARLTPPKTLDAKVIHVPPLVVAPVGKATQLRAIQFVQSKADLLPDAQPALEQLLAFMRDHPTAEILLAGHTDNQGDFDANLKLSQQRVDVVKDYLVSNGIAANRITARGYGPTRPVASNNRESSRQQNRRVEMTVLKP